MLDFKRFREVADESGALLMTDMAHIAGLVAAGVHPSPVPYSDFVTTTTHKTLRGPRAGLVLCRERFAKDIDRALFPGVQGGPLVHIVAAKAVCFKEAAEPSFAGYQREVVANASRLAARLAAGGFRLVSGGTDNHLMLVDVFSRGLTGKVAEAALGKAGITVNKNAIPFDKNPPMVASGIRIGTPAVTTRGMGEADDGRSRRAHHPCTVARRGRERARRGQAGRRGALPEVSRSTPNGCRSARGDPTRPIVTPDPEAPAESLAATVDRAFAAGGVIATAVEGFEPRESQREMAAAVATTLAEGGVLLVEAGTGTGKTLAYLVPAILRGERVLVSTGTKNLQEQIFFKDLPVAAAGARRAVQGDLHEGARQLPLPAPVRGAPRRDRGGGLATPLPGFAAAYDGRMFLTIIDAWAARTETGDRAEIADLPEDLALWNEVSASAENCLGGDCPRFTECFVTRMRQRAEESDVVIVNHHLLFADAALRRHAYGEVIPECPHAVLDEAHQLEDVATQYFGVSVSTWRVEDLAADIEHWAAPRAAAAPARGGARRRSSTSGATPAASFPRSKRRRTTREDRVRLTTDALDGCGETGADVVGTLDGIEGTLLLVHQQTGPGGSRWCRGRPRRSCWHWHAVQSKLRGDLRFLLRASDADYVYFLEVRGRGVFLRAAPIDVSQMVRESVIDRQRHPPC